MRAAIYSPNEIGLTVARYSGDEAICRCPFHPDSRPSSSFNLYTGVFFCFGCGAAYGPKRLAHLLGGYVNMIERTRAHTGEDEREWSILMRNNSAADDEYLASRGISGRQAEMWQLKSNEWGLIFPFFDPNTKELCGIQVRKKEGEPKYVVYGKKPPIWPHDYHMVPAHRRVFFVEGVFGAMNAREAGVIAFATLGAMIKKETAPYISSLDNAYGLFDRDFAGYAAGGRMLAYAPNSRIIIPGLEADELLAGEWRWFDKEQPFCTRSIKKLAELSRNKPKFWTFMPGAENAKGGKRTAESSSRREY